MTFYNLFDQIKRPRSFKNWNNPSRIDFFSKPSRVFSKYSIETGVSDFYEMLVTLSKVF